MAEEIIKKKTNCRICKSKNLIKVLTFGLTPLANAFLKEKELDSPEAFYPLDLCFCDDCSFLQLGHVVSPKILFEDYVYVSSTSSVFINHFRDFGREIVSRFKLGRKSLVVDIGSNDGILLKPLKDQAIKVLGVESAKRIAKIAEKEGIETIPKFFSLKLAKAIVKNKGKAKIVTATNVFAHIDDLDEVIQGINKLMTDDGVFIIEAPYLIDFLVKRYFDLVYHEHLSYWSVKPLISLFKRFQMTVFDVQKVNTHGGSIRVYVKKRNAKYRIQESVNRFLKLEKKARLDAVNTYLEFSGKILENKAKLTTLLTRLKLANKKIVGFGASAKGNTLLNYFKIGTDILDYIIDDSPLKQGLYTPGTHIPVFSADKLWEDNPSYILILAWNFASSIMERHSYFLKKGGRFIVPVPKPRIIK